MLGLTSSFPCRNLLHMDNLKRTKLFVERRRRGWSQQTLAHLAGLQAADVSRIETGRLQPYPSQAERLARVLGIGIEDLQAQAQ